MSESDNSKRASFASSKPALVAVFIGVVILGACIPRTVNHVAAVSPVSIVGSSSEHLSLNGRVESDEIKLAMVMPGTVADVAVREGQHVTKGQVLVRLNSADAEIENNLKAIDQVIIATEKMKSRAELWLAELKRSKNSELPKSDNGWRKAEAATKKAAYKKNNSSKKLADLENSAGSASLAKTEMPSSENVSDKSTAISDGAGQNKESVSAILIQPAENKAQAEDSSSLSSSNSDSSERALSSAPASSSENSAGPDAASADLPKALSKKELKAKYKEQLGKIDKSEKERRKNLKMGYALVQALADSKARGSKSVLASEDLKAAGFTDILKGEILRSGMLDPSQLLSAKLAGLKNSGGSSKDSMIQAELSNLAEKQKEVAASGRVDPKLLAANLSKIDSETLTQLLKSNAVTIDQAGIKPTGKNESPSAVHSAAAAKLPVLPSNSFDAAKLQELLNSNSQIATHQKSKHDFENILKSASSLSGSGKLSTLQIETEIAKADAEIAKAKALKQELLSKRRASTLTSPVDGIISARNINPGEIVLPGRILIRISAPDRFYVRAFIPEGQLSKIKMGQKATVYLDGEKDRPLTATVSAIDSEPSFTPENVYFKEDRVRQVFGIKLRIDNSNGAAKNGMPADAIVFLFEPKA